MHIAGETNTSFILKIGTIHTLSHKKMEIGGYDPKNENEKKQI